MPCCIATAHASAADAEPNTTISPSPRFFTSMPSVSAIAWRKIEKWPRRGANPPHHPVAGVLPLDATGPRDRRAKEGEVPPPHLVRTFRRQARRQLRRAHHVGEEDRDVLSCHPAARPSPLSLTCGPW